jgi:hypothetical protein
MSATNTMNWKRGLWRFWLVLSAFWLIVIAMAINLVGAVSTYIDAQGSLVTQSVCADDRVKNPSLGNPFDCFDGPVDHYALRARAVTQVERYLALGIAPPLTILALGLSLMWVVNGFKSDAAPRNTKPEMSSKPDMWAWKQAPADESAPIRESEASDRYKRQATSGWPVRRYVVPIAVLLILPTAFGGDLGVALCITWHMYAWRGIDLTMARN